MDSIVVHGLRAFSHHGCLKEESIIGGHFILNLEAFGELQLAAENDQLTSTIDYVKLNEIAEREIAIPSSLIENVAHRIIKSIFHEITLVQAVSLELQKINPPINGNVQHVAIKMYRKRQ